MLEWRESLNRALLEREKRRLLRRLELPATDRIDFSSNDYLSLNTDGTLQGLLQSLSPIADIGSTGSRLIRGHRSAFEQCERAFADWVQLDDALLFHSGYAGNVGSIAALMGPIDLVFADRLCHASLLDGIRLSGATRHYYRHNDLDHLEGLLKKYGSKGRRWIVTESVFSMDGDSPDRDALLGLSNQYNALIYLDEAHAIGVTGVAGRGLANPRQKEFAVLSYPVGKAPGLMGCFLAGPSELKPYLVNFARSFVYSTAQPPFLADLLRLLIERMGEDDMQDRRDRLISRSQYLFTRLREEDFKTGPAPSHITPIVLGDEERTIRMAASLKSKGYSVFAIRPPTVPPNACRLRISLHAGNTEEEIEGLVQMLRISR